MPSHASLIHHWQRLRGSDRVAECLRVLIALCGVILYCLTTHHASAMIPAMLGVIACALAETEDHWRSRLSTLLITLICFAGVAFTVEWLLPYPLVFAFALALMTFVLVMLGAISARYATVAGGTLILAVYTMIGTDQLNPSADLLSEPAPLLAGAVWYGLLSLLWAMLSPQLAVRHALARVFDTLADYLENKAALFTPVHGVDRDALALTLAMQNERVVEALNDTRIVLIDRIGMRRPRGATAARLQLYFKAQDIHERISSSHYPYAALAEAFYHSDILFRCEHLLRLQARHCRQHADALRLRRAPIGGTDMPAALSDLRAALDALRKDTLVPPHQLLRSLDALGRNISAIQSLLENEAPPMAHAEGEDSTLQNPGPQSLREAWQRISIQLTPHSSRFRHAIRLALALMSGYGVLHLIHTRHGYWILLTTLLICQPSYGATLARMLQRVLGTVMGVIIGWATLRLLPTAPWQLLLIVLSGVTFFAARLRRYTIATAAITLFVVLCFNQAGNGYEVMWPRLLDTLIGAGIAALSIYLVLPDWQGRQLDQILSNTLRNDARYLQQIIAQYIHGKRDDLAYRIARREAHNADAALSGILANMLREPGRQRRGNEDLLRFLTIAHTMLGHISALGAHRQAIDCKQARDTVTLAGNLAVAKLEHLADTLTTPTPAPSAAPETEQSMTPHTDGVNDETARLVLGQLALILAHRDRLASVIRDIQAG
ncbi:YccS family putative transporter [Dyella caseinilytica]|uniref:TIGR01666 family membrane protein n=1 Tax=Dyella caseinilytica TaxID=1849581 RepID=A0ABX7GPJ5_9GAMM|nr:YccS family putative transporter [Dyella caseinilytica]QRN52331.1 TIGR01666 family membrane protein [Dyella caseinilytica]GGA14882.1 TIGR01666 family membrane protein [Dyella caseinilytica]